MTTKYQKGDKVHLEYTIDLVEEGLLSLSREGMSFDGDKTSWPVCQQITIFEGAHPAIVKHIPRPWEPKPGDKCWAHIHWSDKPVDIIAVDGGVAFCRKENGEHFIQMISDLKEITR